MLLRFDASIHFRQKHVSNLKSGQILFICCNSQTAQISHHAPLGDWPVIFILHFTAACVSTETTFTVPEQWTSQPIISQQWTLLTWQPGIQEIETHLASKIRWFWFQLSCLMIKAGDWSPAERAPFCNKFTCKQLSVLQRKTPPRPVQLSCSAYMCSQLIGRPADCWHSWFEHLNSNVKATDEEELQSNMSHNVFKNTDITDILQVQI